MGNYDDVILGMAVSVVLMTIVHTADNTHELDTRMPTDVRTYLSIALSSSKTSTDVKAHAHARVSVGTGCLLAI